jgi:hypothetical protein
MFNFNPYSILAGFIFSTMGWGRLPMAGNSNFGSPAPLGLALMIYPYFITREWLLWSTGVGLLVLLWFYHHE